MKAGIRKSRKRLYFGVGAAVVVIAGAAGLVTLKGASPEVDASRLATVERGTMVKSVVATGKVEPTTKIEIKSKANGIIKALNADIDLTVNEGDILVELDKEQLAAALRGAEANLLAARASLEGAEAQAKKNIVDVADNRKRAAQSQLAVSQAKVAEARAQVAQAKAAADRATEDVANATIRAPIRGTVLSRDVEIGSPVSSILNLCANATLVMTLGDIA